VAADSISDVAGSRQLFARVQVEFVEDKWRQIPEMAAEFERATT
jgi:hypothetical protein